MVKYNDAESDGVCVDSEKLRGSQGKEKRFNSDSEQGRRKALNRWNRRGRAFRFVSKKRGQRRYFFGLERRSET